MLWVGLGLYRWCVYRYLLESRLSEKEWAERARGSQTDRQAATCLSSAMRATLWPEPHVTSQLQYCRIALSERLPRLLSCSPVSLSLSLSLASSQTAGQRFMLLRFFYIYKTLCLQFFVSMLFCTWTKEVSQNFASYF